MNLDVLVNPKELYLTQGLWDMNGALFWKAFLFETPFALIRVLVWLLFPVMVTLSFFFGYKAHKLYEKNKIID